MISGLPLWKVLFICLGVFLASSVDAIGGGGGLISLPVYLLSGLPTHYALGTNKLSAGLGTFASAFRYARNGYVDWKLGIPSVALALAGAHMGTRLQLAADEDILRWVLLLILPLVAAVMLRDKEFPEVPGDIPRKRQALIVWGCALVVGMYDGFYGPGTGTFLLIAFCRLAKMDLKTASGNVKIVNLSSNIGALATSLAAGKVLVPVGLIAAVFSFAGHYLGAGLMMKKGTRIVTPVILTVLGLLFLRVLLELAGIL